LSMGQRSSTGERRGTPGWRVSFRPDPGRSPIGGVEGAHRAVLSRPMKTQAAVLWGLGEKWSVEEVDLDPPKEQEVLVRLTASGLCHSDAHLVTGDIPIPFPVVGGHEGAGIVEEVGPAV